MDNKYSEKDVRVERQRWSEACDSMVEGSPKCNADKCLEEALNSKGRKH